MWFDSMSLRLEKTQIHYKGYQSFCHIDLVLALIHNEGLTLVLLTRITLILFNKT